MQKAKDNGITFVTIPPYTSHKLQPVDVSVYYPFEEYFAQAMDDWMRSNPGEMVRISHISQFVKHAMIHSMTPNNILAGFQKTGIFPLNTEIFQDADFEVAEMTHRPDPTGGPPVLHLHNQEHHLSLPHHTLMLHHRPVAGYRIMKTGMSLHLCFFQLQKPSHESLQAQEEREERRWF